jgi:hypothetical protein
MPSNGYGSKGFIFKYQFGLAQAYEHDASQWFSGVQQDAFLGCIEDLQRNWLSKLGHQAGIQEE